MLDFSLSCPASYYFIFVKFIHLHNIDALFSSFSFISSGFSNEK